LSDGDDRFHPESPCWDRCKIWRGGCQRRFPASTLHSWPPQPRPLMISSASRLGAKPAPLDRQLPSALTEGWTQRAGATRQHDPTATRALPLVFAVRRVLSVPQLRRKTGARSLRFVALAAASEIRAMPSKSLSLSARVMRVCVRIVVEGGLRADPTVEGARRRMKSLGRLVPRPPRGTETIAVDAGGVKADRIAIGMFSICMAAAM
jgi:hypothetical protein